MKVEQLKMDPEKARELYADYARHRDRMRPEDQEIATIYRQIARGQTVIRALESIRAAGVDERGLPKLAIAPAHLTECWYRVQHASDRANSSVRFGKRWAQDRERKGVVRMPWPHVPTPDEKVGQGRQWEFCAAVPLIPIHLRPKASLDRYHILWEAEWTKRYPIDPFLLRRFGGDAWLVVAAWDLTPVERAVMEQRMNG